MLLAFLLILLLAIGLMVPLLLLLSIRLVLLLLSLLLLALFVLVPLLLYVHSVLGLGYTLFEYYSYFCIGDIWKCLVLCYHACAWHQVGLVPPRILKMAVLMRWAAKTTMARIILTSVTAEQVSVCLEGVAKNIVVVA